MSSWHDTVLWIALVGSAGLMFLLACCL